MRIGLITCSDLPGWEVDDRPLHQSFEARGVELAHPVWNDTSVDWTHFDGCLIRTPWDYCDDRDAFVSWAHRAAGQTLLLNSAALVEWNTHKTYLRELEALGVPTVPTLWLERGSDVDMASAVADQGWARGFIKPMVGATARETLRFSADSEGLKQAQEHVDRLLPDEGLMVQPYLESVERQGELSAIFIDGSFTHGVRKVPVAGDYRVQDDHGASDEPYRFDEAQLVRFASVLGRLEHDVLYARFDLLTDEEGGLRLIELEMVEPSLFFRHGAHAADRLADAVIRRVAGRG